MTTQHLIVLAVPGLRPGDVDRKTTPTLFDWANQGAIAELTPTFPCVTSPVQANMLTGTPPAKHGVIANGFFQRDRDEVEFWVAPNEIVRGEHVWDALRKSYPGYTTAVWHLQNIKQAGADFIVTPAPIHEPDGTTKLWCYSKPDGLYEELLAALGHFPLQHYWGPMANIESTKWILTAAAWLIDRHAPNLHW
ncbi:MAG: alkaline phosphatase family protein, partial [Planctomycetes bacterium]|nr:alkaline phosphatase family protein [Planctomycetota bacterium]